MPDLSGHFYQLRTWCKGMQCFQFSLSLCLSVRRGHGSGPRPGGGGMEGVRSKFPGVRFKFPGVRFKFQRVRSKVRESDLSGVRSKFWGQVRDPGGQVQGPRARLKMNWPSPTSATGTGDHGRYCLVMLMGDCLVGRYFLKHAFPSLKLNHIKECPWHKKLLKRSMILIVQSK